MTPVPQQSEEQLERALRTVLSARKYRAVHPGLARAIAAAELGKGRTLKEAVKATKNQLHRSAAVYLRQNLNYDTALRQLQAVVRPPDHIGARPLLRSLMAAHASTHERLPLLDSFYSEIFQRLPPVNAVLDVACGLHPLARSWMPLPPETPYAACDIFADQIDFLNAFFGMMGYAGSAVQRNALHNMDAPSADIAFLLKTLPCLEQIESGAGERLLHRIDAPILVVSFPSHSLAGRNKGMAQHYAAYFATLIEGTGWQVEPLTFPSEQVYIVRKN